MLVPEGLDRNTVLTHLELHEIIHVNIVDVDLDIWNGDRWEWDLVRKNRELLSIRVDRNFFDLTDLLSILNAVISTNERPCIITGYMTFKLPYNQI